MSDSKFAGQFDGSELTKLYGHVKKPEWGLGVALKEEDGKVDIIFEDGRVRTISDQFYHFIETASRPADQQHTIIAELLAMAPTPATQSSKGSKKSKPRKPVTPPVVLSEQTEYFLEQFPGGFEDDNYVQTHRKRDKGSQLKKHRDKHSDNARKWFAPEAFEGDPEKLFKTAVKLANATDLISSKERKAFAAIQPINQEPLLKSLLQYLHSAGSIENRIDAFILALRRGLGEYPTWTLVTYFLGLHSPDEYPVVTRDTYRKQAQGFAPNVDVPKKPSGASYRQILNMCTGLCAALAETPVKAPRDFIDMQNFIAVTLKPKGRKAILDKRPSKDEPGKNGEANKPS